MQKPASSPYPMHEIIRQRWSPVGFAPRPIEQDKLMTLLEAARWAPSSYNEQPWSFLVAPREKTDDFQRLLGCLVPGNIAWAQHAGVLILSVVRLTLARNGRPNRHAHHDVGMATENLVLQAVDLGLAAHQMGGFDVEKARAECGVPEGYDPLTMIAVVYSAPSSEVAVELATRDAGPRSRKPLAAIGYGGRFGAALDLG